MITAAWIGAGVGAGLLAWWAAQRELHGRRPFGTGCTRTCPACGAAIGRGGMLRVSTSAGALLTAAASGAAFAAAWPWLPGAADPGAARLVALLCYGFLLTNLLAACIVDARQQILPDAFTYSLLGVGPLGAAAVPALGGTWSIPGATGVGETVLAAVLGAAAGSGGLQAIRWLGRHAFRTEAMGFGDVKLMAGCGAFIGWQGALLAILLASLIGAVWGLGRRLFTASRYLAFGPFLALGAVLALLGGDALRRAVLESHTSLSGANPQLLLGISIALMLALVWLVWSGRAKQRAPRAHGHIAAAAEAMRRLQLDQLWDTAPDTGRHRDLVRYMIAVRMLDPEAVIADSTLWSGSTLPFVLGVTDADADEIDPALGWLLAQRDTVHQRLCERHATNTARGRWTRLTVETPVAPCPLAMRGHPPRIDPPRSLHLAVLSTERGCPLAAFAQATGSGDRGALDEAMQSLAPELPSPPFEDAVDGARHPLGAAFAGLATVEAELEAERDRRGADRDRLAQAHLLLCLLAEYVRWHLDAALDGGWSDARTDLEGWQAHPDDASADGMRPDGSPTARQQQSLAQVAALECEEAPRR